MSSHLVLCAGLLKITPDQYKNLQPLNFHIGKNTYTLNANAQIWPRSLNTAVGGDQNSIYLIAADLKMSSVVMSFINGYAFLCVPRRRFSSHPIHLTSCILGSDSTLFTILEINKLDLLPQRFVDWYWSFKHFAHRITHSTRTLRLIDEDTSTRALDTLTSLIQSGISIDSFVYYR